MRQRLLPLQMDVTSVKVSRGIHVLLLAGLSLVMNDFVHAASGVCGGGAPEPPPAYPLPAYLAPDIAAMFVRPGTNAELLSNLKTVLDQQLLAQPAFFDDEVLRIVFNTTDLQWVKPGTPDVASEPFTRPTRIARIRFEARGPFAGMKVDVGLNHKCLESRPHPTRAGVLIPAHTYDSGYISIRVRAPATMTAGEVRQVFGGNAGKFSYECRAPLSMYYPGPEAPSQEAFLVHRAEFEPGEEGYAELCRASPPDRGLPDEHPITHIWIRLIERDYTHPITMTP